MSGRDTVGSVPSILESIPHRPPFSLIDRVIAVEGDTVIAEKRVTADDPLCGRGLGGMLLVEALAQTAACLMGMRRGGDRHLGYLVAASGFRFHAIARPGETVVLRATRTAELGALSRFDAVALVGEREIAAGIMMFSVPPPAAASALPAT